MVRNDDFFLQKWVSYYGAQLGKENLYIFFDGLDQRIPKFCNETNAFLHEKIGKHVVEAEKCRLKFLSDQATKLFNNGYDLIVGVDADEYIVSYKDSINVVYNDLSYFTFSCCWRIAHDKIWISVPRMSCISSRRPPLRMNCRR